MTQGMLIFYGEIISSTQNLQHLNSHAPAIGSVHMVLIFFIGRCTDWSRTCHLTDDGHLDGGRSVLGGGGGGVAQLELDPGGRRPSLRRGTPSGCSPLEPAASRHAAAAPSFLPHPETIGLMSCLETARYTLL